MKYSPEDMQAKVYGDSRFEDIGALPSQFHPYAWKELYIRPFERGELSLLSKARVLKDDSFVHRAVDLTISQDVNTLTTFDYHYIMAWQLIHSFPRSPYTVSWTCQDTYYLDKSTGEQATPASLEENIEQSLCAHDNIAVIHKPSLQIYSLPETDLPPLPEPFDYPRVAAMKQMAEAFADPELHYLAPTLNWVRGSTLQEKLEIVDAQPDLSIFRQLETFEDTYTHGVKRTLTLRCAKCGTVHEHTLDMSPRGFFR